MNFFLQPCFSIFGSSRLGCLPKGSILKTVLVTTAVSSLIVSALAIIAVLRWRCSRGQRFSTRPGGLPQWPHLLKWSRLSESGEQGRVDIAVLRAKPLSSQLSPFLPSIQKDGVTESLVGAFQFGRSIEIRGNLLIRFFCLKIVLQPIRSMPWAKWWSFIVLVPENARKINGGRAHTS